MTNLKEKEYAYQLAIERIKKEIEWTGQWSDKLKMIQKSYFYTGSKEYSVGIKSGNCNLLEVRIGMDNDNVYEFDIKKIFDTAMAQIKGQTLLF